MNQTKKAEMLERRVISMQEKIDGLNKENGALRAENKALTAAVDIYRKQLETVEEARRAFLKGIEETKEIKEQYADAIKQAMDIKKKYSKQFRTFIGRLKNK